MASSQTQRLFKHTEFSQCVRANLFVLCIRFDGIAIQNA